MTVSLNCCSQNGGNLYRAPYYNGTPNIGPRIIGNLDLSPYRSRNTASNMKSETHHLLTAWRGKLALCRLKRALPFCQGAHTREDGGGECSFHN